MPQDFPPSNRSLPFSQGSQPAALIRLRSVSLVYPGTKRGFEALRNVDLEIGDRDFVTVIGPSGCGKTSLLRVIAGYVTPTSGTVTVAGSPHTGPDAEVGVVFQQPNLFPWLSLGQNVEFGLRMQGLDKAERRKRTNYYLQMVGLHPFAQAFPHQLSGGMKQRVAIARALAANPKAILMDEPFASLDAMTREGMQIHLKEIWRQTHKTIFFITHDVEEALLLSTRILVMYPNPGRIVRELFNPFADRLGDTSAAQLRTLREFAEMREFLLASIRDAHYANTQQIY